MSAVTKRRQPAADMEGALVGIVAGLVIVTAAVVWIAQHGARAALGGQWPLSGNPLTLLIETVTGKTHWTGLTTALVVLQLAGLAAAGAAGWLWWRRGRTKTTRRLPVDRAARHMGRGRDLAPVTHRHAQAVARRLGVTYGPGLRLATAVAGNTPLYLTWEQCALLIAGPRTMKTSAVAVPAILDAPGAVIVTTNKRDVIDATRGPREADNSPVHVFDPQGVVGEPCTWWFNPLRAVVDEQTATHLAAVFIAAYRKPGDRADPFFDPKGETLLSGFLLALAVAGRPITDMHAWLTNPNDHEAVDVLREYGWNDVASATSGILNSVPRQRDGVFGTATNSTRFLTSPQIVQWVTPGLGRREVLAEDFLADTGTLYCVSQEGPANAGPVVAALSVAVMRAAEAKAKRSPGGRLPIPLLCVLDEAANVCRWPELPAVYSHYGSRGILLITILQSWAQGTGVWGSGGMEAMWTAAGMKVYGGGNAETGFLADLSKLVGNYRAMDRTASVSRGSRGYSLSANEEPILDVADLAALPAGRVVLFPTGARPTLARTTPWMADRRWKATVAASITAHDPAGANHLAELTARR